MFKLLAFTVVTLVVLYQPFGAEASTKDDVKKAFHSLMAEIDRVLTQAQDALNKALDKVKAKATELEGKASAELDKVLKPLREKLDDLVAKAKAKGFDVAKCQNYVDDFSQTPNTLAQDLIECINKQISKAQDLVNDALNRSKAIEQDLNTIDADIDNCHGNAWKQAKCYAKILERIEKDTKDAPAKILADVTQVTELVTDLLPHLEDCSVEELKHSGEQAAKDVAEFAICAAV
ncbi:unnamed protein product [Ceutorhynchus assimilis]|uniref:Uncharacterized protein n=1 Tax=Ceutorhynchus assimilis TaxID=467358 RepID=A0A9N9QKJ2_9CUCU|nr:unnamed protein product [Ceutorhynchus assimilis]